MELNPKLERYRSDAGILPILAFYPDEAKIEAVEELGSEDRHHAVASLKPSTIDSSLEVGHIAMLAGKKITDSAQRSGTAGTLGRNAQYVELCDEVASV